MDSLLNIYKAYSLLVPQESQVVIPSDEFKVLIYPNQSSKGISDIPILKQVLFVPFITCN